MRAVTMPRTPLPPYPHTCLKGRQVCVCKVLWCQVQVVAVPANALGALQAIAQEVLARSDDLTAAATNAQQLVVIIVNCGKELDTSVINHVRRISGVLEGRLHPTICCPAAHPYTAP
jgi:hypothetical protein